MPHAQHPHQAHRQHAHAQQPAAVAAAAQKHHQHAQCRRQPHGAALRLRQPHHQRGGQRHERVDEGVADAAVEPEERFARVRHELDHQRDRQTAQRPAARAVHAQPSEHHSKKVQKARDKCREQHKRADEIQLLGKNAGLHIAQQRARIGALPALARFQRALPGRAQHRAHAARVAPGLMRLSGKAVIVIVGMVVQGDCVQRQRAQHQRRHAQPQQPAPEPFYPVDRLHAAPSLHIMCIEYQV